jgi:putative ABC transport system ATP-binding protein
MKEVIKLENVKKIYYSEGVQTKALDGISFSIKEGEKVSIIGPSGSGKSTLMHILGLLDKPTSGKIYIEGKDPSILNDDELTYLRGKKIGFVFQNFNLTPSLTAIENVMLPLMFYNVDYKKRYEKAKSLLEKVGIGNRLDYYPSQLSGGEKQRVAIARALINDPSIILADEPTGDLDTKTGHEVLEIFDKLNHEGKTLVIVTHDPSIAKKSPRIIGILDGKIEFDKTQKKR